MRRHRNDVRETFPGARAILHAGSIPLQRAPAWAAFVLLAACGGGGSGAGRDTDARTLAASTIPATVEATLSLGVYPPASRGLVLDLGDAGTFVAVQDDKGAVSVTIPANALEG